MLQSMGLQRVGHDLATVQQQLFEQLLFPPEFSLTTPLFPRQEYWSGFPFPSPGDLPNPGIESVSSALKTDSLLLSHQGSPLLNIARYN